MVVHLRLVRAQGIAFSADRGYTKKISRVLGKIRGYHVTSADPITQVFRRDNSEEKRRYGDTVVDLWHERHRTLKAPPNIMSAPPK